MRIESLRSLVEEVCELLTGLGAEGILVTPGYQYESVEAEIFMTRQETHKKFRRILEISKRYRLTSTPMFLEFAAGLRDYKCSPWSTVTFTPRGSIHEVPSELRPKGISSSLPLVPLHAATEV